MIPSKELFELIKSLSKSEKTYFKKYSRLHIMGKQNKYVMLFDAISGQKNYDETSLIKHFKGKAFASQFPVAKNYLYKQILYAMDAYYNTTQSEVNQLIHQSDFLYKKGLYKQSHKISSKAKQIATQNEMNLSILQILRSREINLALHQQDMEWLKKILQDETEALKRLEIEKIYRDLYFRTIALYHTYGKARSAIHLKEMDKLFMSAPKTKYSKADMTFEFFHRQYSANVIYWHTRGNSAKAFMYTKKNIALFLAHPILLKENISPYISHLHNAIATANDAKLYKEIPAVLEQLKATSKLLKTKLQKAHWFYTYHMNELWYYNQTGLLREMPDNIYAIEKELPVHERDLSFLEKALLYHGISLFYFGIEDFKKTLIWQNRIRNQLTFKTHFEWECAIRLFYLIVHYETGNYELLPHLIKSVYRFLLKKKRVYKYETILLDFFRSHLSQAMSKKKLIDSFKYLRTKMHPLVKNVYEKNAFEHFDLISWLESKIENRPFAEVVRKKAKLTSGK